MRLCHSPKFPDSTSLVIKGCGFWSKLFSFAISSNWFNFSETKLSINKVSLICLASCPVMSYTSEVSYYYAVFDNHAGRCV